MFSENTFVATKKKMFDQYKVGVMSICENIKAIVKLPPNSNFAKISRGKICPLSSSLKRHFPLFCQ